MPRTFPSRGRSAFTLVEMLVVIAIGAILSVLAVVAFTQIQKASNLTQNAYNLGNLLQQARAYAMSRNTYVYVGITEVNALSLTPTAGTGKLVVGVVATTNGERGYDINANTNPIWTSYNSGSSFTAVSKLQFFLNTHMSDLSGTSGSSVGTTGGMLRPSVATSYSVANALSASVTPFSWPLGKSLGSGQYNFSQTGSPGTVIQFDPQGSARIILSSYGSAIPQWIEIGLQPSNGNTVGSTVNQAAIQINGMSGAVQIYRP